jgi:hypothetical protein
VHPTHNFEPQPLQNGWSYGINNYCIGIPLNGITSLPHFMNIYHAVENLLVGGQTDWWFDKPLFTFESKLKMWKDTISVVKILLFCEFILWHCINCECWMSWHMMAANYDFKLMWKDITFVVIIALLNKVAHFMTLYQLWMLDDMTHAANHEFKWKWKETVKYSLNICLESHE